MTVSPQIAKVRPLASFNIHRLANISLIGSNPSDCINSACRHSKCPSEVGEISRHGCCPGDEDLVY
jgi:hypothetical protein